MPPAASDAVTSRGLRVVMDAAHDPRCAADPECVRGAATSVHADYALLIEVTELGHTAALRASLLPTERRTPATAANTVVRAATEDSVATAARALTGQVLAGIAGAAPARPPDRAWYTRWWLWVTVGVGAVGATAVVLAVALSPEPKKRDVVIVPP